MHADIKILEFSVPAEFVIYYGTSSDTYTNQIEVVVISNHLKYTASNKIEDNKWHDVRVEVDLSEVKVYLDCEPILSWTGELDRYCAGLIFSAGRGLQPSISQDM